MAKSQLRGNRESKKPKQPPKPTLPSPLGGTAARNSAPQHEIKKK